MPGPGRLGTSTEGLWQLVEIDRQWQDLRYTLFKTETRSGAVISWPGVLNHADDPELDYFEDLEAFNKSVKHNIASFDEKDCFIDSRGEVYDLRYSAPGAVELQDTGERRTLEQVLGLVKAHAAQAEHCCVAKLWAPTIRDAITIVRAVSEENQ